MSEAIQVFKIGFDGLENNIGNAIYEELLGTFTEKGSLSARGNASIFISELPPMKHYAGWDGNVYPKIEIRKIKIN